MSSSPVHSELQAWSTVDSRCVFENRWLSVHVDEVRLPDNSEYEYTRLVPGGVGVAILGFNRAGEVLLEREYRHGVGEVIWQLPGGLCDADENLRDAGLRELREETGYAPSQINDDTIRYLGSVWDNPALGRSESHVFAAQELVEAGQPKRDAQEYVTLHWVAEEWLREAVRTGQIRDRVVIMALLQHMINQLT